MSERFAILVVDDEPDLEPLILQRMRGRIRSGEYEFRFASNGAHALEMIARDEYAMVVTDINMPTMDGLELLRELAGTHPQVKTIVVSAYGDMANIRAAMNQGAFDFVTKPVDFDDLQITIDRARGQVEHWREAQRDHDDLVAVRSEMDLARRMQQGMLPSSFPSSPKCTVHATMIPALEVGGDFYEAMELDSGRIAVAVADVSGKGVPAALFMMSARTVLKGAAIGSREPADVLREMNRVLAKDNHETMFVTTVYAVYEPDTGAITYANAGHCDPGVIRADASFASLPRTGDALLGLDETLEYTQHASRLEPGETLVLYSDGLSEARRHDGEEFGEDGIARVGARARAGNAREACEDLVRGASEFAAGHPQYDDITCLTVHRTPG